MLTAKHISDIQGLDFTPMTNVFWCTSHNTYLSNFQIGPFSTSVNEIARLFLQGVRVLEIDVFAEKDTYRPLVYHGHEGKNLQLTNSVYLEDILTRVNELRLSMDNDFPLILLFELNLNNIEYDKNSGKMSACNQMAKLLQDTFGNDLLTNKERGKLRPCDYTLGMLRNRVVCLSGNGANENLWDCIAWYIGTNHNYQNASESSLLAEISTQTQSNPLYCEQQWKQNETRLIRMYPDSYCALITSSAFNFAYELSLGVQFIAQNLQRSENRYTSVQSKVENKPIPVPTITFVIPDSMANKYLDFFDGWPVIPKCNLRENAERIQIQYPFVQNAYSWSNVPKVTTKAMTLNCLNTDL